MRAKVVLPEPGGPHKIKEKRCFFSIASRNGLPFPTKCSCPTNSLRLLGRILDARGSGILLEVLKTLLITVSTERKHIIPCGIPDYRGLLTGQVWSLYSSRRRPEKSLILQRIIKTLKKKRPHRLPAGDRVGF